ncbi:Hypothetical predicted protein [Paramuricea clavata]|uniref:Uncharacterized protein n=1 Tax=Paramuricea clavata TaxID=317549 RepID=A0A6S7GYE6_PARCT|nr:Hypothetical predicted protein [Paramuricea clavata]
MNVPQGLTVVHYPRNITVPDCPANFCEGERDILWKNVISRYVWRYLYVKTKNQINLMVWNATFQTVLEFLAHTNGEIIDTLLAEWGFEVSEYPSITSFNSCELYNISQCKRQRRKTYSVQRYECVDEYVDDILDVI